MHAVFSLSLKTIQMCGPPSPFLWYLPQSMLYLVQEIWTLWTGSFSESDYDCRIIGIYSTLNRAKQKCVPELHLDTRVKVTYKITTMEPDTETTSSIYFDAQANRVDESDESGEDGELN